MNKDKEITKIPVKYWIRARELMYQKNAIRINEDIEGNIDNFKKEMTKIMDEARKPMAELKGYRDGARFLLKNKQVK